MNLKEIIFWNFDWNFILTRNHLLSLNLFESLK